MNFAKPLAVCCLGLFLALAGRACAADQASAGPLFGRFSLTLEAGRRTEAIGPFFNLQVKDSEEMLSVPPLFSHTLDPVADAEEFDLLYPLMTYDRFGKEFRWQLLQLLSISGGQNQQEIAKTSFSFFPLYFQQRSPDPDQNYTALLPLYGRIKDHLFRDEIYVVLFPLYSQTRKRDVVTDNYLYPFFHLRHGDALHGWQFWPLAGQEHKGVTTRTNGFHETESIGGHDKLFALWPVFFNQTTGIGTDNPEKLFSVLPIYSAMRSPKRDSTSVLWPFFNVIDDREKKYHEWEGPWPFVVVARGEGKTVTRVLPLFGRARSETLESDSYLWPVYKYNRVHSGALDRDRTRILFFLFSDINEQNVETGGTRERTDLWPLFTRRRDFNGNRRLQILAPLEPILPNNKSVERNGSPLWSLWRSESNPRSHATSQSLLWNLYRRDTTATTRKCSLLFGLFQYQSDSDTKRLRLFYLPVVNTRRTAN